LSESVKCKYGEETCCPHGGAEKTFTSLIAKCYKKQWIVRSTDACFNLDSEYKGKTEECPANQPTPNSIGCTLSESTECKYGEETCCPNGGAEKTFASLIAQCYKNQWIVRSTDACFNPDSECKGKTEECPVNEPKSNSSWCTLSESVECKYGKGNLLFQWRTT